MTCPFIHKWTLETIKKRKKKRERDPGPEMSLQDFHTSPVCLYMISSSYIPCWNYPRAFTGHDTFPPYALGPWDACGDHRGIILTWLQRELPKCFLLWKELASLGHPVLSNIQKENRWSQKKTCCRGFHVTWARRSIKAAVLPQSTKSRGKPHVTDVIFDRSFTLLKQTSARESEDLYTQSSKKSNSRIANKVIAKLPLNWRSRSLLFAVLENVHAYHRSHAGPL